MLIDGVFFVLLTNEGGTREDEKGLRVRRDAIGPHGRWTDGCREGGREGCTCVQGVAFLTRQNAITPGEIVDLQLFVAAVAVK